MRKSARPRPVLIATSQRLTALNISSLSGSPIKARADVGKPSGFDNAPKKDMGVEQELHSSP